MKILICIDDTDNLDSIGTGELLQDLCEYLKEKGLGEGGFITRHQLFISDEIAYTSHNSSMCCAFECEDLPSVLKEAKDYLETHSALGSDPGLCIFVLGHDLPELISFGKRAQTEVLTKKEAYDLASKYPGIIYLSEHGGTGEGIIGALAGTGLRLTGNDGRIKGKIVPRAEKEIISVLEAKRIYSLGQVFDENTGRVLSDDEKLCFETPAKAILKDGLASLPMLLKGDMWVPALKKGRGNK